MNNCKLKYTFAATNSRDALVQAGIIQSTERNRIITLDSVAQEEINKQKVPTQYFMWSWFSTILIVSIIIISILGYVAKQEDKFSVYAYILLFVY